MTARKKQKTSITIKYAAGFHPGLEGVIGRMARCNGGALVEEAFEHNGGVRVLRYEMTPEQAQSFKESLNEPLGKALGLSILETAPRLPFWEVDDDSDTDQAETRRGHGRKSGS